MMDGVESIWEIKIGSISLTLAAETGVKKVKKRHQIGNCRFSSGEAMLLESNDKYLFNSV
jgi:hypothetical protein